MSFPCVQGCHASGRSFRGGSPIAVALYCHARNPSDPAWNSSMLRSARLLTARPSLRQISRPITLGL